MEGAKSEQSEDSVMELSENLFGVDCLGRVDYMKQGGLHEMGRIFRETGWQGRLYEMGRIFGEMGWIRIGV